MGLDMYLEARLRTYNCKWYDKKEKQKREVKINEQIRKVLPEMYKTNNLNYIEITFEVGYWRKANQIHNWFVQNVQEGKDDCEEYSVSREQLKELRDICKKIVKKAVLKDGMITNGYTCKNGKMTPILEKGKYIANPDDLEAIMPTKSGFFFGGTDYDEYYLNDIKQTVKILDKCLKLPEDWDFYYRASW